MPHVIIANSLIRRRDDIDLATFQQHWLDPHGPLTAKLPRCLHYVQNHILDSAGTNGLARELRIDGIPQLAFASPEDRVAAHNSAELKACDKDSELFIGAVSRVMTEVDDAAVRDQDDGSIKQILLFVAPRASSPPADAILDELRGARRIVRHEILQQTHAPGSRVPNLDVAVAGLAEVWLSDIAAIERNAALLDREGVASLAVKTYRFI
jgi:uncharacterized protein (TIGR02118 family)